MRVVRAVVREGRRTYLSDVMTDAGCRLVSIPCSVAEELETHIRDCGADGPIFTGRKGLMIRNGISHERVDALVVPIAKGELVRRKR